MPARRRSDRGAAVVDFVLVLVVLIPLFLGILQVALVLHVRNTLVAAASEGARYAATVDRPVEAGADRTRRQIADALAARFARDVRAHPATVRGAPGVEVEVTAEVPPLGLWGPGVRLHVAGHAVEEVPP
ncbi:MAG TPA: TadE/TadG family type IV pilus assembly protein [Nocardioidaceae bacterium]|nr:TadE/TadG family type IV pilus assembly protein [Nocardioidaceae bacterium]